MKQNKSSFELEHRERGRDARRQGFARQQFEGIHKGKVYDLELDTSVLSPGECVARALEFYHGRQPLAFQQMRGVIEGNV